MRKRLRPTPVSPLVGFPTQQYNFLERLASLTVPFPPPQGRIRRPFHYRSGDCLFSYLLGKEKHLGWIE